MVTASASTPITATATNQVSHSTPSKPNNRPSRQMCADMTPLPGLQTASPGDTLGSTTLVLAPGTPRPSAAGCKQYTRAVWRSVSYVTGSTDSRVGSRTCVARRDARVPDTKVTLSSDLPYDGRAGLVGNWHDPLRLVRKELIDGPFGATMPGQTRIVVRDEESPGYQARVEVPQRGLERCIEIAVQVHETVGCVVG